MKFQRGGISAAVIAGVVVVIVIVAGVGIYYATQAPASNTSSTTPPTTTSSMMSHTTSSSSTAADQALYTAAQAEGGTLVVYGSVDADQFTQLSKNFSSVFPGITVQYTNFSPSQIFTRISSEEAASGHSADLVIVDGLMPQLQSAGYVVPYVAPGAAGFPKQFLDPTNSSTPINLLPVTMVYNTQVLSASQLPQNLTDLASARWSGKIAMHDPTLGTGATHYWAALSTILGNDTVNNFLKSLRANVSPKLMPSPSGTESAVSSGQFAIGFQVFLTDVVGDINNGAPVAPFALKGIPVLTTVSAATILTGVQHPNSAKLLVDYLASSSGQTALGNVTNQLPKSSIRLPVSTTVQTIYSLNSLVAKYLPGTNIVTMPNSVLATAANNAYKATFTAILKS